MSPILSFRDLEVWQAAMDLVVTIYKTSGEFPAGERFGLTAQIRRAVISVPSNIAEGHARRSDGAYFNHVRIALGSLAEVGTQVEVAARLRFVSEGQSTHLLTEIGRVRQMLHGLSRSIERRLPGHTASLLIGWLAYAARTCS